MGAPAPRSSMSVGFCGGIGPSHPRNACVWGTCGNVALLAPHVLRHISSPEMWYAAHSSMMLQVCTLCCPGVPCHFSAAWRWHTEGAQGVLGCPLGIAELSEPVSVDNNIFTPYIYESIFNPRRSCIAAEVLGRSAATTVYWGERKESPQIVLSQIPMSRAPSS